MSKNFRQRLAVVITAKKRRARGNVLWVKGGGGNEVDDGLFFNELTCSHSGEIKILYKEEYLGDAQSGAGSTKRWHGAVCVHTCDGTRVIDDHT